MQSYLVKAKNEEWLNFRNSYYGHERLIEIWKRDSSIRHLDKLKEKFKRDSYSHPKNIRKISSVLLSLKPFFLNKNQPICFVSKIEDATL